MSFLASHAFIRFFAWKPAWLIEFQPIFGQPFNLIDFGIAENSF
jgi:hypothetical protein